MYLLDGESHFQFFTGIVKHLSSNFVIPEMIVVGIVNTNRNRDLTPTHDPSNFDPSNGGGEIFTAFLQKELVPYIDAHYATAPYRLLVGHSLGGLLVVNTLLKHPGLFTAYAAVDPSLWWDKMQLLSESAGLLSRRQLNGKTLFLAFSNSLPAGMTDTAQAKKDTTTSTIGFRAPFLFESRLLQTTNKSLRWQSKYYPNEFHGSIPLIGSYDALKFIFDFYRRPSFQVLTDSTAFVLVGHYQKVSEKMGYTILPPEADLAGLAWRSAAMEKNFERALTFLQLYERLYPNSPGVYDSWAQYYKAQGDEGKAKSYFEKAEAVRRKRTSQKN